MLRYPYKSQKERAITMNEFKTETGYFRNNKKYGKTTKLVNKITGEIVFVGMGICSRKSLYNTYINLKK